MPSAVRSLKQEQRQLTGEMRAQHKTWAEIATALRQRYGLNMRAALRMARGWSQRDAADAWNQRWPADAKTFKNFSYWETWPAPTGHAPSLEVLTKLAELYECRVADLLLDYGDFRAFDSAHRDGSHLAALPDLISPSESNTTTAVDELVSRLESTDVHELARLIARWAEHVSSALSRRALLLRLSAGLSLAAASPALAEDLPEPTPPPTPVDRNFAGIWHSRYVYTSTGRGSDFVGEHFVVIRQQGNRLLGESVPASNGSILKLDLTLNGSVATGTWSERTSPTGYYRGAVYHGAIQLIVDPMGKTMSGKWLGFDREFKVNSDTWELRWVQESTKLAQREYHLKA